MLFYVLCIFILFYSVFLCKFPFNSWFFLNLFLFFYLCIFASFFFHLSILCQSFNFGGTSDRRKKKNKERTRQMSKTEWQISLHCRKKNSSRYTEQKCFHKESWNITTNRFFKSRRKETRFRVQKRMDERGYIFGWRKRNVNQDYARRGIKKDGRLIKQTKKIDISISKMISRKPKILKTII